MFETIEYDAELAQKAREHLRRSEETFLTESRLDKQEKQAMYEVLLYLNNLITTHYTRYHEVVNAVD
ncbi:hypothetical protein [Vibrio quintilis]|uniref:Uncharacterized protein n=1 Tax=Vibrio quintilis TaxID=1117707 RepID=A0A1M7YPE0_9VIBR|nr:hypothetical protein [Vibrio quintilis]SHO54493.1 hypothetical protein VQ7734_00207 [Vibrio quintilis]